MPIIVANGINEPLLAESAVETGVADFIGMARASLADPALPQKAAEGRFDEINYCIRCLQGCEGGILKGGPIRCMVNPTLGRESQFPQTKAAQKKKVLVIGAGPGGMEAAVAAARRGHEVTLWEKADHVGGEFIPAMFPPAKGEYAQMITFLRKQLAILNVTVVLNKQATVDEIRTFGADKVIIATGGQPNRPNIPGIETNKVIFARDVLTGKDIPEGQIVIIGGGEVGTETAAYLADCARGQVTIIEMSNHLGHGLMREFPTMRFFREQGVQSMLNAKVNAISADYVEVTINEEKKRVTANAVILAAGYHPNNQLLKELQKAKVPFVAVGDVNKCTNALDATQEGFEAGYNA
ncbi:FAD-dependent oxidoreductase [Limosilactobacillus kribbianus]|uniref:FAD-dependent oxidoreductase n=1 Tax=Limosilactobacillus kribbianus TaxID=2982695 RepID=UPI002264E881|nr:FAD-dependent oxidoreductase [Limosilactobacillus kribbianus]